MSRIRPMKFVHVVYRTRRFEQMVRWYQTVFGAKVQYQNPALAFLTARAGVTDPRFVCELDRQCGRSTDEE
jgi:catechol 2,3-dioxygenase-like lactoylglutathione lyase family enzyme